MSEAAEFVRPFRLDGHNDEAVVLLHGFTGHAGHWRPVAAELHAAGYTVTAPLLAGHSGGAEEMAAAGWRHWLATAREAADDVADHRRVHLAGLSLGGLLAIMIAHDTAAASIATLNSPLLVRNWRAYFAPFARRLIPSVAAVPGPVPDDELAYLWFPHSSHSTEAVAALMTVIRKAWWAAGRIRRPTLVLQSRRDDAVFPVSGRLLARRLGTTVRWIDTAHNALLDRRRSEVAETLLAHLANSD